MTTKHVFSKKVLELTKKIPKGKVSTYKLIATKLKSKAYRAVGAALKSNDRPIIIPCHRVVASDGSLGGYCGKMNSQKKIRLLKKESTYTKRRNNKYYVEDFEKKVYKF